MLQVLCEVVKSGPVEQILACAPQLFSIATTIEENTTLASNTVVRKSKLKLVSRIALRFLATKSYTRQRKGKSPVGHHVH